MSDPISYTFSILRYVHDVAAGERVNVGVALFAPKARFLGATCTTSADRVSLLFPGLNREAFVSAMESIQGAFRSFSARLRSQWLSSYEQKTALDIARTVLPVDDSSLQWEAFGSGLTTNPEFELRRLFERMVQRYELPNPAATSTTLNQLSSGQVPLMQVSPYMNALVCGANSAISYSTLIQSSTGVVNTYRSPPSFGFGPTGQSIFGNGVHPSSQGHTTFGSTFDPQTRWSGCDPISGSNGVVGYTTSSGFAAPTGWVIETVSLTGRPDFSGTVALEGASLGLLPPTRDTGT